MLFTTVVPLCWREEIERSESNSPAHPSSPLPVITVRLYESDATPSLHDSFHIIGITIQKRASRRELASLWKMTRKHMKYPRIPILTVCTGYIALLTAIDVPNVDDEME